jgi:hypothetical protein
MLIYLVCDTSGSMEEWGKNMIARGVVRAIEQYLKLGYGSGDLKLISWGNEACVVEWHSDQEFPPEMLKSRGSANVLALVTLIGTKPVGKVLLLTDGSWVERDVRELKRWKENLQPETLRIIKIGADANPRLNGKDVFTAENLFAALDGWLEGGAT